MFASRVKDKVEIKDDDGNPVIVNIRKLSNRSLAKAALARQGTLGETMRRIGADNLKAITSDESKRPEKPKEFDREAIERARFGSYDYEEVVRAGVESWTSPEPIEAGVADLDKETVDILAEAILRLSLGPVSEEEWRAEQGKG